MFLCARCRPICVIIDFKLSNLWLLIDWLIISIFNNMVQDHIKNTHSPYVLARLKSHSEEKNS